MARGLEHVRIEVGENESFDSALERFRRCVNKAGHLQRKRFFFESSLEKRKRELKERQIKAKFMRFQKRQQYKQQSTGM